MRNHLHLVIETPSGNLVAGMKWLLGVYTMRFNIRHRTCGHLFAGRYKALVVDGSGNGYLPSVQVSVLTIDILRLEWQSVWACPDH